MMPITMTSSISVNPAAAWRGAMEDRGMGSWLGGGVFAPWRGNRGFCGITAACLQGESRGIHPGAETLLALKLLLVPAFLWLISLAGRRWGPAVAGWLAGLPVVTGPILFFIAVEQGVPFAAEASAAALSAVLASVSFSLAYARACRRRAWPLCLLAGLAAWLLGAWLLSWLPRSPWPALAVALGTLLLAPRLFPHVGALQGSRGGGHAELLARMFAGAALTVGVTAVSAWVGPGWSGLLTVFPVLGIVLAVFSHRTQGSDYVIALLRAMASGLYSFAIFCLVLALALPPLGTAVAFTLAVAASLGVQVGVRRWLMRR